MGDGTVVGGGVEVSLKERGDVGWKDAIEKGTELGADGSRIGKEGYDGRGGDERRKERHHRRIGRGLGEVKTVVIHRPQEGAVKDGEDAGKSFHAFCP
jgi:hypothetical protein